jgi:hypothetical protein
VLLGWLLLARAQGLKHQSNVVVLGSDRTGGTELTSVLKLELLTWHTAGEIATAGVSATHSRFVIAARYLKNTTRRIKLAP